ASIATDVAGQPVGMIVWRHAGGEAEVLTLAVRPDHRRRGAARCLLEDTVRALPGPVTDLLIEVAVGNEAARALYDTAGFEAVGRRPAYYAGREDALIMRRRLRRSPGDADCMT